MNAAAAPRATIGDIKLRQLAYPVFALVCIAAACAYHSVLDAPIGALWEHEQAQEWPHVGGVELSRSFEYDSVLYQGLFSGGVDAATIVNGYTSMPNVFGIALFYKLVDLLDWSIFYVNLVLLVLTGWIIAGIAARWRISPVLALAALYLNPATVYYAQTATKEIPLVFLTTLFSYFLVAFKDLDRLIVLLAVTVAVIIMRLQSGLYFGIVVLLLLFSRRNSLRLFNLGLFAVFLIYPLSAYTSLWDGADSYRAESTRVGIGIIIDTALRTLPFAGYICIPLRAIQNACDPFPFSTMFSEGSSVWNVYAAVNQVSFYLTSFIFIGLLAPLWKFLRGKIVLPRGTHIATILLIFAWVTVAIVPYVHGRYLYPCTPLAALAFVEFKKGTSLQRQWLHLLMWGGIAGLQSIIVLGTLVS